VIGTRKVSYILYLTDPLPLWTKEEGGQLELYDSIIEDETDGARKRMVPKAFPCKTIIPTFNNMAYFVVKPGESCD
jgi:Rps23 Pro-64 3,4-dihydroxylase Tpa1-like proline 4-hydroxylase